MNGAIELVDGGEMMVDISLGVSIPAHHASDFTGKQNSLHGFVVKREFSEKGFSDLLGEQLLGRSVCCENLRGVGERGPKILKTAIEDVFKCVAVMLIHVHTSSFFSVVDCKVVLGDKLDKLAGEGGACQKPQKLDAEDQEETVNVSGNIFVHLDTAECKLGIIRWQVTPASGAVTVVIAVNVSTRTASETTTGSRSILV